jgi:hypothetical protein
MCGKNINESQFREAFSPFGTIEEIWVLKDRVTQEPKVRRIPVLASIVLNRLLGGST